VRKSASASDPVEGEKYLILDEIYLNLTGKIKCAFAQAYLIEFLDVVYREITSFL
jgi:hypothetical protein